MNYDKNAIRLSFQEYWRKNKNNIQYKEKGKLINGIPPKSLNIQVDADEPNAEGFFPCITLGMRLLVDNIESTRKGDLFLKVIIEYNSTDGKPQEKVVGIKDNTIWLKD